MPIQKRPSPVFDLINSQPVKRKTPTSTTPSPHPPKRQKQLSGPSQTVGTSEAGGVVWTCTGDCQATFDVAGVMGRWRALAAGDPPHALEADRAVGWCELTKDSGKGVWLVVRNSSISCFNVSRYANFNMATYALSHEPPVHKES